MRLLNTSVIKRKVKFAISSYGFIKSVFYIAGILYIAGYGKRIAVLLFDIIYSFFIVGFGSACNDNFGSLICKSKRGGKTNSCCAACNKGNLSFELVAELSYYILTLSHNFIFLIAHLFLF